MECRTRSGQVLDFSHYSELFFVRSARINQLFHFSTLHIIERFLSGLPEFFSILPPLRGGLRGALLAVARGRGVFLVWAGAKFRLSSACAGELSL